jgi:hypothetical protein
VNAKEWKGKYLYSDMHELFFMKFPCMLHEWLKRQAEVNSIVLPIEPIVWDQAKLDSLKVLDNKWTQAIDFFSRPNVHCVRKKTCTKLTNDIVMQDTTVYLERRAQPSIPPRVIPYEHG